MYIISMNIIFIEDIWPKFIKKYKIRELSYFQSWNYISNLDRSGVSQSNQNFSIIGSMSSKTCQNTTVHKYYQ